MISAVSEKINAVVARISIMLKSIRKMMRRLMLLKLAMKRRSKMTCRSLRSKKKRRRISARWSLLRLLNKQQRLKLDARNRSKMPQIS